MEHGLVTGLEARREHAHLLPLASGHALNDLTQEQAWPDDTGLLRRRGRADDDDRELGYQEVKASGWLTEFLAGQGFKVEKGIAGVDTAFRATIETGEGPTIAIMCEYDALPGIGHACGHNVIATAGAGAGAALAAVRAQLPKGRIQVIGTPAEEGGGGKVRLIKGGV